MIEQQQQNLQEINNNSKQELEISLSTGIEGSITTTATPNQLFHLDLEDNLNDWIELSDENHRLKKVYDKLRCEYNDLEFRYENMVADKNVLQQLFQRQMAQLCDMKKLLNNSIELNEYEQICTDLEHSSEEIRDLINRNKLLRKQLDQKEMEIEQMQPIVEDLREQNEMLREQISAIGENCDITAKLLCDIDLMQTKINEYLVSINNLTDENQELRNLLEQYRINNNHQSSLNHSSSTLISSHHCPLFSGEVVPSSISLSSSFRQNSISGSNGRPSFNLINSGSSNNKLESLRCSYSNLNLHMLLPRTVETPVVITNSKSSTTTTIAETMADVKINDLEQQISKLKEEMFQLEKENKKLQETNLLLVNQHKHQKADDDNTEKPQSITVVAEMTDKFVQTDPISLKIETRKIIRCPLDHHHNGVDQEQQKHRIFALAANLVTSKTNNMKQQSTTTSICLKSRKQKKKKRRFLCLF